MTEDFAYRAKVLITQRRYQDAVRLCRRGLLTDPTREEGRIVLGMALLAMRRSEEVRAEMVTLLSAQPADVLARRLLGQAYLQAGDLARAQEELEAARQLAPDDRHVAELLTELDDAREAAAAVDEASAWSAEPSAPRAPVAARAEFTRGFVADEVDPVPGDDETVPDNPPASLAAAPGGMAGPPTKVLPPETVARMRRQSAISSSSLATTLPAVIPIPVEALRTAPVIAPPVASRDRSTHEGVSEPPTEIGGPQPQRPMPLRGAAASAAGWPDQPPPTITPIMPALVRAAARLAAATRGTSSVEHLADPEQTPAVAELPAAAPLLRALADPLAWTPPTGSTSTEAVPTRDPHEAATKSYAEASDEARAREAAARGAPKGRKPSIEDLLLAQARFAEAVSEVSEISEVAEPSAPIARAATPRPPPDARPAPPADPVMDARAGDEERESTVTEVPQSYRAPARTPPPSSPGPAARLAPPPTVVARPVGALPTQGAESGASSRASDGDSRGRPAPLRPVLPEAPRARGVSETVQAPALGDERVTRALAADEQPDRPDSPAVRQPPSFLDPVPEAPRRPLAAAPIEPARPTASPARPPLVPASGTSRDGPSRSRPSVPPRVTLPVAEDSAEPLEGREKRTSKPTVDGTPKNVLTTVGEDESMVGGSAPAAPSPTAMPKRPSRDGAPRPSRPPPVPGSVAPSQSLDPLDRPLLPEDFESGVGPSPFSPSAQAAAFLPPDDLLSGSEQVPLPTEQDSSAGAKNPLDDPISPDDFSYDRERAKAAASVSLASAPGLPNPLDEPLSPDDFSRPGEPAPPSVELPPVRPRPPAPRPLGPAPPMSIPRDLLREVPVMQSALQPVLPNDPLDEPLAPSDFSGGVASPASRPKRADSPARGAAPARADGAGGRQSPVRIVSRKGQPPVKVPSKQQPRSRPRNDSRLLRYAVPSAVVAVLLVLGLWSGLHWHAGRQRADRIALAEAAEAVGDYPSLQQSLQIYREVSGQTADSREYLARLARAYAALAYEFGLPAEQQQAQNLISRLRALGPAEGASAPIEATATAYLLARDGRLEQAEQQLAPFQAPDPHMSYLRGRIALHRESFAEAARILRDGITAHPSWVRQSCALVEAMLGQSSPQSTDWYGLLEELGNAWRAHVGVRILRARLYAASASTRESARLELQNLSAPRLWNAAAPSERAWIYLLRAYLSLEARAGRGEVDGMLRRAREERPAHDTRFRLLFARVLVGLRQLGDAKTELRALVQESPGRVRSEARLLLAETHLELEEVADADRELALVEESPRRHLLKGKVYKEMRQLREALREFEIAKQQDPSLAFVADLESARAHLRIGDTTTAVQTAQALERTHPDELAVFLLLGETLLANGRPRDAEAAYRSALRIAPDSIEPRLALANLARWRGELDAAVRSLDEIVARDPSNLEARVARASIAGELGDVEDARQRLANLRSFAQSASAGAAVALLEAELSIRAGQLEGVEPLLQRAEGANADEWEAELKHVRGVFKLRTYRIQDALSALRRAQELVPGDPIRLAELARAYLLAPDNLADAGQTADRALALDRGLADALAVKALVAIAPGSGNLGAAAQLLRQAEQALEARRRDANVRAFVLAARGLYEYTNGNAQNAARALQQAVELDPTLAEAHYYLGLTYQDLRRRPDGCREIEEFLRRASGTREARDAENDLRSFCR